MKSKQSNIILIVLILSLIFGETNGQNWNMIYADELEAEEYMLDQQYQRAAKKYMDAKRQYPESYNLTFRIGYCFLLTDDMKQHSIEFLEEAAEHVSVDYDPRSIKETSAPIEALFYLGKAYQIANRFEDAIRAYQKFLSLADPRHELRQLAEQQVANSKRAPSFMKDAIAVVEKNLGSSINDASPNFNAVISGDGQTLAYTTLSRFGFDIYVVQMYADGWGKPRRITNDLRRKYLKTSSLSYDGIELILSEDMGRGSNLYVSVFDNGKWSKAIKLKKPINTKFNETHASMSADGQTIYFTSDRPGGLGGMDIYKTTIDDRGRWTDPVNLGPTINTPLNEESPFITEDNILFFSSEGHEGLGGYDVFYANLSTDGKVQNLGYPINTSGDDLFFQPEAGGRSGYMAYFTPTNVGMRDIHYVSIVPMVNLVGMVSANDPSVLVGNSFDVIIQNNETQEVIASVSSSLTDSDPLHRVAPGSYTVSVTNPNFEDFSTSIEIPTSYALPSYIFSANLNPIPQEQPLLAHFDEVEDIVVEQEIVPEPASEPVLEFQEPIPQPKVVEVKKVEVVPEPQKPEESLPPAERIVPPRHARTPSPFVGNALSPSQYFYTIQIMALTKPLPPSRFSDVDNLLIISGDDGLVRYTSGMVTSLDDANSIKTKLQQLGYTDAFIRPLPLNGNFTIQIMALTAPTDITSFGRVSNLIVRQGPDRVYRFSSGCYSSYNEASENLQAVVGMGFKDAFIQRFTP